LLEQRLAQSSPSTQYTTGQLGAPRAPRKRCLSTCHLAHDTARSYTTKRKPKFAPSRTMDSQRTPTASAGQPFSEMRNLICHRPCKNTSRLTSSAASHRKQLPKCIFFHTAATAHAPASATRRVATSLSQTCNCRQITRCNSLHVAHAQDRPIMEFASPRPPPA